MSPLGRRAPNTFAGSFHMSLGCRRAGYEVLRTVCASKCDAPSRKPALIALRIVAIGGLQKLLFANLTLLIFVVCAYENRAVLMMGVRWAQPKQGPGCGWIANWWLSIMCALWDLGIANSGVVFAIFLLMMGRVHKSVVRSLYPLKIILFS